MLAINNSHHDLANLTQEQVNRWTQDCLRAFPTDKKYDVIYADPPWTFGKKGNMCNQAHLHYPTMTLDELADLPVNDITKKDCALFLWACSPLLPQAIELMSRWGFTYKTVFKVWTKRFPNGNPVNVPGWWSRPSTELLPKPMRVYS